MIELSYGDALVYYGDCFDMLLPDEPFIVISDPPYGNVYKGEWDKVAIDWQRYWDKFTARQHCLFGQVPSCITMLNSNLSSLKYELIWDKGSTSNPFQAGKLPMKCHENIFVFYKKHSDIVYNPQMMEGEPYMRPGSSRPYGTGDKNYIFRPGRKMKPPQNNSGTRYPLSIIRGIGKVEGKERVHPTQKPVKLMEWLVKSYTNPGDIVVDPFMGSGSTGIACLNTGRRFIGCELDRENFKAACFRLYRRTHEDC